MTSIVSLHTLSVRIVECRLDVYVCGRERERAFVFSTTMFLRIKRNPAPVSACMRGWVVGGLLCARAVAHHWICMSLLIFFRESMNGVLFRHDMPHCLCGYHTVRMSQCLLIRPHFYFKAERCSTILRSKTFNVWNGVITCTEMVDCFESFWWLSCGNSMFSYFEIKGLQDWYS